MAWFRGTLVALGLLLAAALAGGCKQGEGDFCQIDSDCAGGLTCNAASMKCQSEGTVNTPDASTTPDARSLVDGAPGTPDAAGGTPDASAPDATPEFDAAPPDAGAAADAAPGA